MKNAIILCSGGLDSVVTANYVKKKLGYSKLIILFFDYGQRTIAAERRTSKMCASDLGASFVEIKLNWLGKISTSLINSNKKTKKVKIKGLKDEKEDSDNYYVPNRNTVFLDHAIAFAESLVIRGKGFSDIFVGFSNEGVEAYPDTTIRFVNVMNKLIKCLGLKVEIIAPLIKKDKSGVVKLGEKLGVKLFDTYSCYAGVKNSNKQCGTCLACRFRQEAFYWANVIDKTSYEKKMKDFRSA